VVVAFAIAVLSALLVATFALGHSRAERARARAQMIADFAAALAHAHLVTAPEADANVVSLEAFRIRRHAPGNAHAAPRSRHATR